MSRATSALLLALACSPYAPENTERIEPPTEYRGWWSSVERCVGVARPFDSVRWWVVAGEWEHVGYWIGDDIYVGERFVRAYGVVQHEALHAILRRGDHPAPPFGLCAPR